MKWEQIEFQRVTPDDPAVDAMLTALRNTNCILDDDRGVVLACFEACDPDGFDEVAKEDRRPDEDTLVALIRNPSIRGSIEYLEIRADVEIPDLHVLPLRVVEGKLANRLRHGGALGGMNWSVKEAQELTHGLLEAVLDHRLWRVTAAITDAAWTDFFFGKYGAGDLTVMLLDVKSRRFIVLAVTDSD
jgi:hypothetical protein